MEFGIIKWSWQWRSNQTLIYNLHNEQCKIPALHNIWIYNTQWAFIEICINFAVGIIDFIL